MLTALRIGNFKAFAEARRIPVRPMIFIDGLNRPRKANHETHERHERKIKMNSFFEYFVYFAVK
jgi:hypothetical protein